MTWEDIILSRKRNKWHFPFIKRAIEDVIANKNDFSTESILPEISKKYIQYLVEGNIYSTWEAARHAKAKINILSVGSLIGKIGSHKIGLKHKYIAGNSTGRQIRTWRLK